MTQVILLALAVLQADTRIKSSIKRSLGSLKGSGCLAGGAGAAGPCPKGVGGLENSKEGVGGTLPTGVPGLEASSPAPPT